jgi:hypothetical protein
MRAEPIAKYIITAHAAFEMARRGISEELVSEVMVAPEQRLLVRTDRVVLQSRLVRAGAHKAALVRVFVDVDRVPPEVVTVYATSKIAKYWSPSHES